MSITTQSRANSSWRRIYTIPFLLAVISSAGLVLALMAEGAIDIVSSLAIAFPLIAAAWRVGRSWLR